MRIKVFLWAICLFFVFQSCQKTGDVDAEKDYQLSKSSLQYDGVISLRTNVTVKDGTLHFKNDKTFFKDLELISKMSDAEFLEFEKNMGFKSLSTSLGEAYESFDKLKNVSNMKEWEVKYGDIVGLKDSVVTPLVPISTYQRIANRAGEYYLGDAYAKITEGKIVTILDGDKNKLAEALKAKVSNVGKGVFVDKLVQNLNVTNDDSNFVTFSSAAPCGGGYLSAIRATSNRKVWVDYYVVVFRGITEYAGEIQVTASAHKKTWLGWNKYKTLYRIENINFSIVNGKGQTISAYDSWGNNNSDSYTYTRSFSLNDVNHIDHYVGPNNFSYAAARAVSRGTSPYWAVVCCNTSCPSDYGQYY